MEILNFNINTCNTILKKTYLFKVFHLGILNIFEPMPLFNIFAFTYLEKSAKIMLQYNAQPPFHV